MKMRRNQTIIATMCFLLNFYSVSMRAIVIDKIDCKVVQENKEAIRTFIYDKKEQVKKVANMPTWLLSWGSWLTGQEYTREDIENSSTTNRLFDPCNDHKLNEYLNKLGTEEDIEVLNNILNGLFSSENCWSTLQQRLHEQTLKFLKMENQKFTRGEMKFLFNKEDAITKSWIIPDEAYFRCMTRNFVALYFYENMKSNKIKILALK